MDGKSNKNSEVLISPSGSLTYRNVQGLVEHLFRLASSSVRKLRLDLGQVEKIDGATVHRLVLVARKLRSMGVMVCLENSDHPQAFLSDRAILMQLL